MDKLFLTILNMSLTGAFVIAAICLARLPLKKAPKIISYCLWAVAGFRLVFPFSIESVFSLIPFKAQTIPPDIAMQAIPRIDSGIPFVNNAVSRILPAATPAASVNPLQVWTTIGAFVWLIGVAVMVLYGVVSYVILKRKVRGAAHIEANIHEAEMIQSPFVLGVFKPKIYLPVGLSAQERGYILLHEQTHIRRCDHIIKFAAYFILCLHWFNPLAWAACLLMGADMELSCDERVLKEMGGEMKKDYSLSLLSFATERRIIGGSPLAFGEGGAKERIKNVLNFKKPSRVIVAVSVALVAVLIVGFAANQATDRNLAMQGTLSPGDGWSGNMNGKSITLEDVRTLAEKGDSLLFEDFEKYTSANVSSNLDYNIMVYGVEGGYRLIVRSEKGGKPDSVNLESIWASGGSGIDIRSGDIDEFLRKWPVIMQVKDGTATPSGVTVTLKNVTDAAFTYGESYTIQRKTDYGWIDVVPVIENYGFNDIGYMLEALESEEILVDWEWLYGKLPAGDYRIAKEALCVRSPGDYDTFSLFAAFTIGQ